MFYQIPGNPYDIDVFTVEYDNNIVHGFVKEDDGKYRPDLSCNLLPITNSMEIQVGSDKVTLESGAKALYNDLDYSVIILETKIYVLNGGAYFEINGQSEFDDKDLLEEVDGNLYELLNNGTIKVGTNIVGYDNGNNGGWVVYNGDEENIKILPSHHNWSIKYNYDMEKTNQENLEEVKKINDQFLNSNFATRVDILTKAEAWAFYSAFYGNKLGKIYAKDASGNLIGLKYELSNNDHEIESAINYKVAPIITLDKDVKVKGRWNGYRIYK